MTLVDERMAGWLHGASIDPTGAQLPGQIELAKALATSAQPALIIDLAAYAYGRQDGAEQALAFISEHATKLDPGWSGQQGSLLTRRVAAAALVEILESQTGKCAAVCALALGAAEFDGLEAPLTEFPGLAQSALIALADEARSVPEMPGTTLRARVDTEFKTLPAPDAEPVTNQQLREYLGEARAAVRALAELSEQRQQALAAQSRRTSEEVDLLWWVLEPFSDGVGGPWEDAGRGAVVATGLEIARRLTAAPPARGTFGFVASALRKAGATTDERSTLAAVTGCILAPLFEDQLIVGEGLCWSRPVLSALRARRSNGTDSWAAPFAAAVGVSSELEASVASFALQLVRDVSLDRLVSA